MNMFASNFPDLKRLLFGGKTPRKEEVAKLRSWRDQVRTRMAEINLLVPETHPGYTPDSPISFYGTQALAKDDPCRPDLIAEYETLQRKYRGTSDAITTEKRMEGTLLQ